MSFCWDLALPADTDDMQFLCEGKKYRVYYYSNRYNETVYQGEFKSSFTGSWFDDADCCTHDPEVAQAWFNDAVNPSEEE
jgi:hypothetical protein